MLRRTNGNLDTWTTWRGNNPFKEWNDLELNNGWENLGGSDPTAQYALNGNIVYIKGMIKGGTDTTETVVGVLPVGFRPKSRVVLSTVSKDATTVLPGRIHVETNGEIKYMNGGNDWFSLDGTFLIV